jgi:hypothetical protein
MSHHRCYEDEPTPLYGKAPTEMIMAALKFSCD